ncbi:hypothetical protein L6164_001229 [Bauhinia variegata]|uniref:Uncharacterized protein n=1 Tax=Bauhinia variegata TaxID=167791 RepID=A0ACB9Q924_BAUVA|nr:hypothetical protein L6164_001229 [Bauhinia variegata]
MSPLQFAFLLILVIAIEGPRSVEGRGPFRCPRMIDCNNVCQGFTKCCVDGQCICQPCSEIPPPALPIFNFN